ncbi:MAG: FMN-binding negative transcriptional regulator [Parvibaculum sp.]|uniref:FMN-binding negative transcriptional regulator n=1 Tax=Parvibaculum sp. TaxID=2024848 RepID=UPI002AB8235B|nr:FMN-binding negative transcriptional regulator [Parvibaculum sp.]MDZ4379938.1 FMN-binding negative transcriptional regulator [Parvibaculum sp.]
MYVPPHFAQKESAECLALIEREPFGLLVTGSGGAPFATHLPFLLQQRGAQAVLTGHVARANPHWRAFDGAQEALAVFQGPHGYISPAWYASSAKVPTWNYVAVHAYGAPRVVEDAGAALEAIASLTARFETGRPDPWTMSSLPDGAAEKLLAALVVFEMPVVRLEGKWKLGQHMVEEDRLGAVAGLEREGGDAALAEAMRIPKEVV